jgi:hypothetical protein
VLCGVHDVAFIYIFAFGTLSQFITSRIENKTPCDKAQAIMIHAMPALTSAFDNVSPYDVIIGEFRGKLILPDIIGMTVCLMFTFLPLFLRKRQSHQGTCWQCSILCSCGIAC